MRAEFERGGLLTSPCSQTSGLSFGLTGGSLCHIRHMDNACGLKLLGGGHHCCTEPRDLGSALACDEALRASQSWAAPTEGGVVGRSLAIATLEPHLRSRAFGSGASGDCGTRPNVGGVPVA
jgi:hypothetical protein